jgi:hypothetical protein
VGIKTSSNILYEQPNLLSWSQLNNNFFPPRWWCSLAQNYHAWQSSKHLCDDYEIINNSWTIVLYAEGCLWPTGFQH